jgi:hypothetical protein
MNEKRQTSQSTQTRSASPPCPKCGRPMSGRARTKGGKIRYECRPYDPGDRTKQLYCYSTTDPSKPYRNQKGEPKAKDKNPQFRRKLGGVKRFIITAAQNATPVNEDFLASLLQYSKHNDAELVVIPLRYKNPTSRWTASQANSEIWDDSLTPYLYNQRKKLNENLVLLGDIKTVPTATRPLSGFEGITHGESGILAHTKLQLNCVPTPQNKLPKIMTTTGACTVKNYTDSKAGKKGEFHHSTAALVVEIKGAKFFMRHVNWDGGGFIDLEFRYTPDKVEKAPKPYALVFGDTHRAVMCPAVEETTFGQGGMVSQLDPEYLVFHDLHDGASTNHHIRKDPFAQIAKRAADLHLVEKEIREDVAWLEKVCAGRTGIVVPSNHDDFLARWLREQDWRLDPENSEFYLETALALVRGINSGTGMAHPFTHWVNKLKSGNHIQCLERDESFMLGGIELSMHGDKGPNGARGSIMNLRRVGVKTIIGHSHTPGIEEGAYQCGTSTGLRLDYNSGPSSWLNAHCVLYGNGKRALLPIIDGEWRLE